VGVASAGRGPATASRHTSARHRLIPPEVDPDGFIESIRAAVAQGRYEVVLPSGDAEVVPLSSRRDEVEAVVPYAPHAAVMRAFDKLELHRAGQSVGLLSPSTAESSEQGISRRELPVFVKARLHSPEGGTGPARLTARRADNPRDVSLFSAEIRSAGGIPVLQEIVEGQLLAVSLVVDGAGRIVSAVQQVADKLSSQPGISVQARTVPLDPRLKRGIARLMRELEWFGLAELQFVNPSQPTLIDFNGRLYGSLALALGAGANLPAIWAALATGRQPPPAPPELAVGRRYHWLEGDLRRALRERRGGLAHDLGGSLRYSIGATHSIWRLEDPAPTLAALPDVARRASSSLTRLWRGPRKKATPQPRGQTQPSDSQTSRARSAQISSGGSLPSMGRTPRMGAKSR